MSTQQGIIKKVSGPLVIATSLPEAKMYDVVKVGASELIGEIIEIKGSDVSIQVYEETSGVGPGEKVVSTGKPLSVELGPGLLTAIYDGIQRPLDLIQKQAGDFLTKGIEVPPLDPNKKWKFIPTAQVGSEVQAGDVLGEVQETTLIKHRVMVPPSVKSAKVSAITEGEFTIMDTVAKLDVEGDSVDVTMRQVWPIRSPRPYADKLIPSEPLVTGQRVIDTFFPVAKGGTGCIPGPFGAGKTVVQHQLAKWADADIVVFIGCGERGNEMTDVLAEFPELIDPKTGEPLMKRTILIANTSNMPVAAREASVYTGITLAEYYRDMGYKVALMADSTSRWAEALREISGRLEEMPGEEGYPAYLGSRTATFYERAGEVNCLGSEGRKGSLTVVGAVSPPGGDLSEPVTQNTLRVTKVFWSLDSSLAYRRHYPAINWLNSYSLYTDDIKGYVQKETSDDWDEMRKGAMNILQQEASLQEIVRLVGLDALSPQEQWLLETARSLREDFLQQFAFDDIDGYTSLQKQYAMLNAIMTLHAEGLKALENNIALEDLKALSVREKIAKAKRVEEKDLKQVEDLAQTVVTEVKSLKPQEDL